MARHPSANSVVVLGLGRFGMAVAGSLVRLGHDVLGIDEDADTVQRCADAFTHVAQADGTSTDALRALGVAEFQRAVVGIGSDLEASVLTVLALEELGVPDIWAKATSVKHGRILERTGAHHVVYPEAAMGERVAHLVTGRMIDFIEFDDGFAIAKIKAPELSFNSTLAEAGIREKHGITVVGVKRPREPFIQAVPDTVVYLSDLLIVSGPTAGVERFAALT
mgnify:CR=1 FL=1